MRCANCGQPGQAVLAADYWAGLVAEIVRQLKQDGEEAAILGRDDALQMLHMASNGSRSYWKCSRCLAAEEWGWQ